MAKLVNVVHVTVADGYLDQLKGPMMENARRSVEEAGCHQFDVIVSGDDDHTFMFYEVYDDEAALASHRETAHFKAYWHLLAELGDKVQRTPQLYWVVD